VYEEEPGFRPGPRAVMSTLSVAGLAAVAAMVWSTLISCACEVAWDGR